MAEMPLQSGASTSDLLTALKSVVSSINNQTQTNLILAGLANFTNLTSATVVKTGAGRLVNISVIVNGSGNGTAYDAISTTDTTRPMFVISDTAIQEYNVNLPFLYGLVIAPGTGQTISGSFS